MAACWSVKRKAATTLHERLLLWWIVPLIAVAGVGGVGLQMFFTYLWIIAKGHAR